jgi:rubrerythrin
MDNPRLEELLLQSLEHEMGGVRIYEAALTVAQNDDLIKEWTNYHEQTEGHVRILKDTCAELGIDPTRRTPGREILVSLGESLVEAIQNAGAGDDRDAAELVACECVVLAETKDHLDWELLSLAAKKLKGEEKRILQAACESVEEQEDEHLYHTKGWCRELWLKALGLHAVLPPPEERKHVKTAIGAARAQKAAHH